MWKEKVLLVDDEKAVLDGLRRRLRRHFNMTTALSGAEALAIVAEADEEFAVVVSDCQMPEMDGIQLLKKLRRSSVNTIRMMLTGNSDQDTATKAVNDGHIFRFMSKPCPDTVLTSSIVAGIRQYRLVTAEKVLLEETLQGCIKVLTEILSITEPEAFNRATRIQEYAKLITSQMQMASAWEIETASLLAPIAFLTLPPELKTKLYADDDLSDSELDLVKEIPDIGHRLISNIPRMTNVSKIVRHCGFLLSENLLAQLKTDDEEEIPIGARLIRILSDLVELEDRGHSLTRAVDEMKSRQDEYDATLFEKSCEVLLNGYSPNVTKVATLDVPARDLLIGDVLKVNIETADDRLLLRSGTKLTAPLLERINNYRRLAGVKEPVRIERWTTFKEKAQQN